MKGLFQKAYTLENPSIQVSSFDFIFDNTQESLSLHNDNNIELLIYH